MNTIYRKDRRMIRATTEYHLWSEVPYESQLRIIRALATVAIDCDNLQATYIYVDSKKYNIDSIRDCVSKEIDVYEGKD